MFGTIRRHQTWLWGIIITLTVISFVLYFSPYSKVNSGSRREGNYGFLHGEKISDQQYRDAYKEVDLNTFIMSHGHWMGEDRKRTEQDINREVYQWLLLEWEQDRFGIHVDDQSAAEMGRQMIGSFARAGITSPQMFIERVLQPHGLSVQEFERYVRHFIGIQELISTVGLSGRLITPQEAKALYQRDYQQTAGEASFFSESNYLAGDPVTPQTLSEFYSNRVANYAIPARVIVSYVRFDVTNYMPQAQKDLSTNIDDVVTSDYDRLGTNAATLFPEAKTPEQVKARIREEVVRREALNLAAQKANDFARTLYDLQPARPQNLQDLARTNGLEVRVSSPFDQEQGPSNLEVHSDFTKAAFSLSAEDPFAGPISGQDGVYVIALDRKLPYEVPKLDQIRPKVEADYKRLQAMNIAQQTARNFYIALTNDMARGKSFSAVCAAQNIKSVEIPPFSLATQELPGIEDQVSLNQLKQAALATPTGHVSRPEPTAEGAMILYVKEKLPMDTVKMDADLPKYLAAVRRSRQQEAFDAWFRSEAEKNLRVPQSQLGNASPS